MGASIPSGYQPTGQGAADQGFQSLFNSNIGYAQNLPGQTVPGMTAAANNIANNPYAGQQQAGANATGAAATGTVAPNQMQGAQALQDLGNQGQGYGAQILQQGFDPQSALYNRNFQQNQDQTNAINAMYGLGSSPYGAGVANQSNQNFNLDWQNQQLARENSAITGYGNLGSSMGNAYTGASNLGSAGLNTQMQGANLPYQTYGANQGNALNAYSSLAQGVGASQAPSNSLMGDLATYLGLGQSANAQAQTAAQQNNPMTGLGNLFGGIMGLGTGGGSTVGGSLFSLLGL